MASLPSVRPESPGRFEGQPHQQEVNLTDIKTQKVVCLIFELLFLAAAWLSAALWAVGTFNILTLLFLLTVCGLGGHIAASKTTEWEEARFLTFRELKNKYTWDRLGELCSLAELQQKCQNEILSKWKRSTVPLSGEYEIFCREKGEFLRRRLITPTQWECMEAKDYKGFRATLT